MGGGVSKIFSARTISLKGKQKKEIGYGSGASGNNPELDFGEMPKEDDNKNIYFIFLAMCLMLADIVKKYQNDKIKSFLIKYDGILLKGETAIMKWIEFKQFSYFLKGKSIKEYYGYESVRDYIKNHFSISFITWNRNEWMQYLEKE